MACAVMLLAEVRIVPVSSGSVNVRSVFVLGAAMVSVPVPLTLPANEILDNLCLFSAQPRGDAS